MPQQKRFAIYARTATQQEQSENFPIQEQIRQSKEYGIGKGYQFVEPVFEEVGSGVNSSRPVLEETFKAAGEGKFDILIIRDYARLARKPALLHDMIRLFAEMGVEVESASEQDEVMAIAEAAWETVDRIRREQVSKRMQAGKQAKKHLQEGQ